MVILALFFLNPIRDGLAVALVSAKAHKNAVHVGAKDFV